MKDHRVTLNKNICLAENLFSLTFSCHEIASEAVPGQFLQLRLDGCTRFTLRRPFSIASVRDDEVEVIYRVAGEGTSYLSRLREGTPLAVLGPLGNGFDITPAGRMILIAGGIGLAPLKFLAERLHEIKRDYLFLYGAKTAREVILPVNLAGSGEGVLIFTDDGSRGRKGLVTDGLMTTVSEIKPAMIFACGPRAMLKNIQSVSSSLGVPAQLSMEEKMACGLGACLCCVCETVAGYKKVCSEGPVFKAEELVL